MMWFSIKKQKTQNIQALRFPISFLQVKNELVCKVKQINELLKII